MADDTFQERFTGEPDPVAQREGGLVQTVPQALQILSTPEGRQKLVGTVAHYPIDFAKGVMDFFTAPHKAIEGTLSPEEAISFGLNGALATMGGAKIFTPSDPVVAPFREFHEQVSQPAAERITVPLDERNVIPERSAPVPPDTFTPVEEPPTTFAPAPPEVAQLPEARNLGVIGPDRPDILRMPPREAAAAATQDVLKGPSPDQPTAWRERWEGTLDKMQTPEDARKVISAIVDAEDEFQPARQGDLSPGQIEKLGLVTGLDTTKIDIPETSAKIKNDAEIRNIIEAFRVSSQKIKDAAGAIADKRGLDDAKEIGDFIRLGMQRDLLLDAAVSSKEFAGLRGEFARIGHRLNEAQSAIKEAQSLSDFLGKEGDSLDDIRSRARLIADTDDRALPKVLSAREKGQHWFFHTWTNFLISGLITHSKYAVVNTAQTALNQVFAPLVSNVISKARGRDVSMTSPIWGYTAMIHGFPDAINAAAAAFKTGQRVPSISEMQLAARGKEGPFGASTPYQTANKVNWGIWKRVFNEDQLAKAAKITGMPSRSANSLHTIYRMLNEHGSMGRQAYEKAFSEKPRSNAEFWQRYEYWRANPTDEMLAKGVGEGYDGTYMAKMSEGTARLLGALKSNPVTKWIFPFTHIPSEIVRTHIRYSPLAAFGPEMRAQLLGQRGEPAQSLAMAKVIIGTAGLSYFFTKAMNEELTGSYPVDQKERRRWRDMNIQPNSALVDGEWHSMERLGPAGLNAGLAGDLAHVAKHYDINDENRYAKAIAGVILSIGNSVSNDIGFQSLKNIIDLYEGTQKPERFLSYQASTFINPSLTRQFASMHDPYMREANNLTDGLKYSFPFVREGLRAKLDPIYGEPIRNPGYATFGRNVPANQDFAKAELDRLGYYPSYPSRTIGGVRLNEEQFYKYQATAGPLVKQALDRLMNSPRWPMLSPEYQVAAAKQTVAYARKQAATAMQIDEPDLVRAGRERRLMQIRGQ